MDIAKAIAIIMVVAYYVRLLDASTGRNYAFIDGVCGWLDYIHMPVFFFISGWLPWRSKIGRGATTLSVWRNRALSIGLPFVVCTVVGNLAQAAFNGFVKHPHAVTTATLFRSLIMADGMPWPHRWFLIALMGMLLLYPIYKKAEGGGVLRT